MRFKLTPRFMLFAVLCVGLTSEELWLRNALAFNTSRIVFASLRDGNFEIYVMDADGGNQDNLTNHPAYDRLPDWSPDGTKIAFASRRNGDVYQIYVMDADGKNPIRLTDGPRRKEDPDWSPDGQQIAFTSWRDDWNWDIYAIGADGQGLKRVTHDLAYKSRPAFSPDGQRIAYMSEHEGFNHIYVVGADGRNRKRLTHNEENHWDPAWFPDGQVIAYYVLDGNWVGNLHGTIHLMASNGRYIRQLSDGGNARDFEPDISPVGLAVSPTSNKVTIWGKLKKVELNRR